ncbi:hypothetical protein COLO4_21370 [Corchorus olitorius]|uniref:Uncharacterized protein n=1 Tax=Corchorus olitorius TaxID=93759 RepID=A0A1R3ITM8_9ROSI|nr:hypothetical protein COLO4_21370 [Corchorus olitorius]
MAYERQKDEQVGNNFVGTFGTLLSDVNSGGFWLAGACWSASQASVLGLRTVGQRAAQPAL